MKNLIALNELLDEAIELGHGTDQPYKKKNAKRDARTAKMSAKKQAKIQKYMDKGDSKSEAENRYERRRLARAMFVPYSTPFGAVGEISRQRRIREYESRAK